MPSSCVTAHVAILLSTRSDTASGMLGFAANSRGPALRIAALNALARARLRDDRRGRCRSGQRRRCTQGGGSRRASRRFNLRSDDITTREAIGTVLSFAARHFARVDEPLASALNVGAAEAPWAYETGTWAFRSFSCGRGGGYG